MRHRIQMVGTQRSGSNLLRLMLSQLPDVFAPPSAHLLRDLEPLQNAYQGLGERERIERLVHAAARLVNANVLKWPQGAPDEGDVLSACREGTLEEVCRAIYDMAAEAFLASNWVCKCLEHVHKLGQIEAVIPDVRVIHIVRDPRGVALSFGALPVGPKDPRISALRWIADQTAALSFREHFDSTRWAEVKYEALVSDPRGVVRSICEQFGLEFTPEIMRYYLRDDAVRAATLSPLWRNLAKPIQPVHSERFTLPEHREYVRLVEETAFDLMQEFGYSPRYATGSVELSPERIAHLRAADDSLRREAHAAADPAIEEIHQRRNAELSSILAEAL